MEVLFAAVSCPSIDVGVSVFVVVGNFFLQYLGMGLSRTDNKKWGSSTLKIVFAITLLIYVLILSMSLTSICIIIKFYYITEYLNRL